MKKAIILHGMPSKEGYYDPDRESQSNCHWLPWLQHELVLRDILAQAPELPKPYEPDYDAWGYVFELFKPDEETILVGHSAGGGFLTRWLSENKDKNVGRVVLVAPSLGYGWSVDESMVTFDIDPDISSRTKGLKLVWSTDDSHRINKSVNRISKEVKDIEVTELEGLGHLTERDMGRKEFPELLDLCIS